MTIEYGTPGKAESVIYRGSARPTTSATTLHLNFEPSPRKLGDPNPMVGEDPTQMRSRWLFLDPKVVGVPRGAREVGTKGTVRIRKG